MFGFETEGIEVVQNFKQHVEGKTSTCLLICRSFYLLIFGQLSSRGLVPKDWELRQQSPLPMEIQRTSSCWDEAPAR